MDIINYAKIKKVEMDLTQHKLDYANIFQKSSNLINEKTITLNKNISVSGKLIDSPANSLTDYISVMPNTLYVFSTGDDIHSHYINYFDGDKNFIKRLVYTQLKTEFTTDENVHFVRIACVTSMFGKTVQLNIGDSLLPFEKYYVQIPAELIPEKPANPYYFPPTEITGIYKGLGEDYSYFPTVTGMINAFRDLATAYPNYITETLMGNDASGTYPIYQYHLKPLGLDNSYLKPIPKMLLTGGIHGGEKPSTYSLFCLMRDICEKWSSSPLLEYLRFNVELVIMPLVNPYAFAGGDGVGEFSGRHNYNGVDLNRNFSEGWAESTIGTVTYGGPAPFSEVEAQYIKIMIDSNADAIYFGDYHSQGGRDYNLMWLNLLSGSKSHEVIDISAKYLIEKLTREFVIDYNLTPDQDFLGYILHENLGGTAKLYAHSKGIPSNTIETFNKFPDDSGVGESTIKASTEYIANWLLTLLKQFRISYNY